MYWRTLALAGIGRFSLLGQQKDCKQCCCKACSTVVAIEACMNRQGMAVSMGFWCMLT